MNLPLLSRAVGEGKFRFKCKCKYSVLALLLALAGCASQRDAPVFQAVSSETATVRWQRRNLSLAGDATCTRATDGAVLIRLEKQRSPLLDLQLEAGGTLTAKGRLAGSGWSGPYAAAPLPLATWANFISIYRAADKLPVGARELHTAGARIAYDKTGVRLKSLSIANTDTAETLSALFRSDGT